MLRTIIEIDGEKCNGCGQCVTDCAEGALAVVDGKARLVSDIYCDGLGACLNCPQGALRLIQREAEAFNAEAAEAFVRSGKPGHIPHKGNPADISRAEPLANCHADQPGYAAASINRHYAGIDGDDRQKLMAVMPVWPVQLRLMPPGALFLHNADILLAAHCSGFVLPGIQQDWISGRVPLIACPKLDPWAELERHLSAIVSQARPARITILRMHVPCCGGLEKLVREVIAATGKELPFSVHTIRPAHGL